VPPGRRRYEKARMPPGRRRYEKGPEAAWKAALQKRGRGGRVTFGQLQASNPTIHFMGHFKGNFKGKFVGNFMVGLKTNSKRNALESRARYNSKS
jgi:hypothetical protein